MEIPLPLIKLATMAIIAMPLSFVVQGNQLSYNYYKNSCPNLESLIKKELMSLFLTDVTAPSAFLRLVFHDCQVQGCDASILLDTNYPTHSSEMTSSRNFGIKHRETINDIKTKVEEECPGQVSCADILMLAAKVSVSHSGGPFIQVPLGRKDSTTSSPKEADDIRLSLSADAKLPSPTITVDEFIDIFKSKGMSIQESVAILGAHTLGVGHCLNIAGSLYNQEIRDNMNLKFKTLLTLLCPTENPLTNVTVVPIDITPIIFDNQYYRHMLKGKALFGIDLNISRDPRTAPFVTRFAKDQRYFFETFSSAFVKLSSANVLTNMEGEVRRKCNQVN